MPQHEPGSLPIEGPAESYTITRPQAPLTREIFLDFLASVQDMEGERSVREQDNHYLVTTRGGQTFTLALRGAGELAHVKALCGRSDAGSVYTIRSAAYHMDLHVRHDATGLRLPRNPQLLLPYLVHKNTDMLAMLDQSPYRLSFVLTGQQPPVLYLEHQPTSQPAKSI